MQGIFTQPLGFTRLWASSYLSLMIELRPFRGWPALSQRLLQLRVIIVHGVTIKRLTGSGFCIKAAQRLTFQSYSLRLLVKLIVATERWQENIKMLVLQIYPVST
ncbi:hypothetical protein OMCYN_01336 [cyanobiont of Ornithocercus magnificus]|nr:hypothetical protein OMCYN_01336 [cyanobiont of Ornithocercus magnificus]